MLAVLEGHSAAGQPRRLVAGRDAPRQRQRRRDGHHLGRGDGHADHCPGRAHQRRLQRRLVAGRDADRHRRARPRGLRVGRRQRGAPVRRQRSRRRRERCCLGTHGSRLLTARDATPACGTPRPRRAAHAGHAMGNGACESGRIARLTWSRDRTARIWTQLPARPCYPDEHSGCQRCGVESRPTAVLTGRGKHRPPSGAATGAPLSTRSPEARVNGARWNASGNARPHLASDSRRACGDAASGVQLWPDRPGHRHHQRRLVAGRDASILIPCRRRSARVWNITRARCRKKVLLAERAHWHGRVRGLGSGRAR